MRSLPVRQGAAPLRRARFGLPFRVAVCCLAAGGCTGEPDGREVWQVDSAQVTGASRPRGDSLHVDVYVDATVSMAGYAAAPTSNYVAFLDDLEATIQTAWRRASVRFHRFGADVRPMERSEFLSAKRPAFYTEKITGIDRVVDCQRPRNVSVVVTDLFQSEGDINAIVGQIKQECLQRGVSVAVLGVKSQYAGTVYDARVPAYRYASTADTSTYRPFYALMFGDAANLEWLLPALGSRLAGGGRDAVVVAPRVVRAYSVAAMQKPARSRELNARTPTGPYRFNFDLRDGARSGTMLATIVPSPSPGAPPVRADRLELVAYRRTVAGRSAARADSSETRDITLDSARAGRGDTLHLFLNLGIADPPGTYAYKLVLRTGAGDGFGTPAWVARYSSTNPTPAADANKTLNLTKFVLDLRRASSSVAQPALAVWYVTVRKL